MSTGHHTGGSQSTQLLEKLMKDNEVVRLLYRPDHVNREYDLPYLGGYSEDGKTIYIDRHLPDKIEYELDGRKTEFAPIRFIKDHESFEKAVMDALGWGYEHAHKAATAFERRHVVQSGLSWKDYQRSVERFVKVTEHESIKKVPADLDMRPYYAPPVNKALIAHMEAAMGKATGKQAKAGVSYSDEGMPASHCGPVKAWPKGQCVHFVPTNSCELVRGYISPRGWCRLWKGTE